MTAVKCPYCKYEESKVIDSRHAEDKKRRRRECLRCGKRFTTYETVEQPLRIVIKRNGAIESYDRNKLLKGMYHAVTKRPVSVAQVNAIADEIEEAHINNEGQMTSAQIGALVLERLKELDHIAYIRFASVYQDFKDEESFIAVITALENEK